MQRTLAILAILSTVACGPDDDSDPQEQQDQLQLACDGTDLVFVTDGSDDGEEPPPCTTKIIVEW